jgi:hypothetical protein
MGNEGEQTQGLPQVQDPAGYKDEKKGIKPKLGVTIIAIIILKSCRYQ